MSPSLAPALSIEKAALAFDGKVLFQDLSFEAAAGEITCLLGASGVGKSSLLRMIAGLDWGATGQVRASDGGPVAPRSAYMAQQDLLLPWLTLLENALLGARLRGESPDLSRARALLADLRLEEDLEKRPAALSGGMRQRAALARTLMEDRPVILMDEPFSALDAVSRLELQTLAFTFLRKRTVLLVTHDPLEAARLADRMLVFTGDPLRLEEVAPVEGLRELSFNDPRILEKQGELITLLEAGRRSR